MAKGSVNIGGLSDEDIDGRINLHNASADAHKDIRSTLTKLSAELEALKLRVATDVSKNPFAVTFGTLDAATVTGVWDEPLARIEF